MNKTYKLLDANGEFYQSSTPGELGGNRKAKIYGQCDCSAANSALKKGYAQHRVFFEDEKAAIAAGFRPCGRCMRQEYSEWAKGGQIGTQNYPWLILPPEK